jgi:GDP-L-fucose synthase
MSVITSEDCIYVAGHRGLVGSAFMRALARRGHRNIVARTHGELDLTDQAATLAFFGKARPDYVLLAAARVGGILANDTYPAQFIRDNLAIQTNVIHAAYECGVKRLLFLGTACIYPKRAPQPLKEEYLLTGPLEATNRAYAVAKISGIEMCWSYNRQYGTKYAAVMPASLFGPGDNYDLMTSHVVPALLRKFHEAKLSGAPKVTLWGTGKAYREFIYVDDMADICLRLLDLPDERFAGLLGSDESKTGAFVPPFVNVGVGTDMTIDELALMIRDIVGFKGAIEYDSSKPDGTFRKVLDVSRLHALVAPAITPLPKALAQTYQDYLSNVHGRQPRAVAPA